MEFKRGQTHLLLSSVSVGSLGTLNIKDNKTDTEYFLSIYTVFSYSISGGLRKSVK